MTDSSAPETQTDVVRNEPPRDEIDRILDREARRLLRQEVDQVATDVVRNEPPRDEIDRILDRAARRLLRQKLAEDR